MSKLPPPNSNNLNMPAFQRFDRKPSLSLLISGVCKIFWEILHAEMNVFNLVLQMIFIKEPIKHL